MKRAPRRTKDVTQGLRAMVMIVTNIRNSVGEIDDANEDRAIMAAIRWVNKLGNL